MEKELNDVAIERMKYKIKQILHPEMGDKEVELYFGDVDYADKELPGYGSISFFQQQS